MSFLFEGESAGTKVRILKPVSKLALNGHPALTEHQQSSLHPLIAMWPQGIIKEEKIARETFDDIFAFTLVAKLGFLKALVLYTGLSGQDWQRVLINDTDDIMERLVDAESETVVWKVSDISRHLDAAVNDRLAAEVLSPVYLLKLQPNEYKQPDDLTATTPSLEVSGFPSEEGRDKQYDGLYVPDGNTANGFPVRVKKNVLTSYLYMGSNGWKFGSAVANAEHRARIVNTDPKKDQTTVVPTGDSVVGEVLMRRDETSSEYSEQWHRVHFKITPVLPLDGFRFRISAKFDAKDDGYDELKAKYILKKMRRKKLGESFENLTEKDKNALESDANRHMEKHFPDATDIRVFTREEDRVITAAVREAAMAQAKRERAKKAVKQSKDGVAPEAEKKLDWSNIHSRVMKWTVVGDWFTLARHIYSRNPQGFKGQGPEELQRLLVKCQSQTSGKKKAGDLQKRWNSFLDPFSKQRLMENMDDSLTLSLVMLDGPTDRKNSVKFCSE